MSKIGSVGCDFEKWAVVTRKGLIVLVFIACAFLGGLLSMSVELYRYAERWEFSTLQKEFVRQSDAAAVIVAAGLGHFMSCALPCVISRMPP
jgi:hypothetical protein